MTSVATGLLAGRERLWAQKVSEFIRSPSGRKLLPEGATGWADGGCDELAAAFEALLGDRAQRYGVRSLVSGIVEHWVVRIRGTDLYLDERGAHDREDTERHWTQELIVYRRDDEEGAELVEMSDDYLTSWRFHNSSDVGCNVASIKRITKAIQRAAGNP